MEKHAQQMLPGGRVGRAVSLDSQANIRNGFSIDRVTVTIFTRRPPGNLSLAKQPPISGDDRYKEKEDPGDET